MEVKYNNKDISEVSTIKEVKTKDENKYPIEEKFIIALLLTFIGGFLDSYTYVLYDKIFSNTQTGNIILFGIYLTEGHISDALLRLFPVLSFFIAIFLTQFFIKKFANTKKWIYITLFINMIILLIIAIGCFVNSTIIITCFISFICANMICVFKKFEDNVFAPIMCTGNLRSFSELFSKYILYKNKSYLKTSLKYLLILVVFIFGVSVGLILVNLFVTECVILCIFILLLICYLIKKG